MKKSLLCLAGAVVALAFASCAYGPYYDPYYATSYSVGYGEGYGYGGSSFSTSLFISTGDPRWGYDPGCHSYYDYHRHCYYDPYLYGYYPIGYRPVVVYGAPHPYGWNPGRNYIRPPSRVTNITISNYRDRESAYRSSSYSWARQVQSQPRNYNRPPEPRASAGMFGNQRPTERPSSSYRPTGNPYSPRESQGSYPGTQSTQQSWNSGTQRETGGRPSRYGQQQQPMIQSAPQPRQEARGSAYPVASPFGGNRPQIQPQPFGGRQQAQPQPSGGRSQAAPQRGERKRVDEQPLVQ